jgi:hypothetical protein
LSELAARRSEASDETNAKIDDAIRNLIEQAFNRACDISRSRATVRQESAQRLLDKETFVEDDLAPIRAAVIECRDHGAKTTFSAGPDTPGRESPAVSAFARVRYRLGNRSESTGVSRRHKGVVRPPD